MSGPPPRSSLFPYTTLFRSIDRWVLIEYRGLWDRDVLGGSLLSSALKESKLPPDRKSTRLNSSHMSISYAVFCLKKKKKQTRELCGPAGSVLAFRQGCHRRL